MSGQRLEGAPSLGFRRDDLIEALHGGSTVRKLDYLLATERYADAYGRATDMRR
jgi:1-aminocyclopropane-1-carboxylate deaminase/D-cysteine desulfhydrase-like pyridoxal-dependent ACC family enzyme